MSEGVPSDYERLGGEEGLRVLIEDFMDRVFADDMIGFLFAGKPKRRIVELEIRLAAAQLGGPRPYEGRSMREAHRRSPILGGHFARRRKILQNTLEDHGVPEDVIARWLAHVDALRDEVLGQGVSDLNCNHDLQALRMAEDDDPEAPRPPTEPS